MFSFPLFDILFVVQVLIESLNKRMLFKSKARQALSVFQIKSSVFNTITHTPTAPLYVPSGQNCGIIKIVS